MLKVGEIFLRSIEAELVIVLIESIFASWHLIITTTPLRRPCLRRGSIVSAQSQGQNPIQPGAFRNHGVLINNQ